MSLVSCEGKLQQYVSQESNGLYRLPITQPSPCHPRPCRAGSRVMRLIRPPFSPFVNGQVPGCHLLKRYPHSGTAARAKRHFLGSSIETSSGIRRWPIPTTNPPTSTRDSRLETSFSLPPTTPRSRKMGKLRSRHGW